MNWKDIKGFNGYQVSDDGQVRSFKRSKEGKLLTPHPNRKGYLVVGLIENDGNQQTKPIHRLVLMTFAPCDNMDELTVDHIDGNKLNNTLDNLQWLSNEDNVTKATQTSEWKHCYNYSRKGGEIEITFEDGHIEIYPNIARAVEGTGMCKKTLVRHLEHPEGVTRAHRNIKVRVIER